MFGDGRARWGTGTITRERNIARLCGNSNGANLEERAGTVHSRTPCPLRRWHALAVEDSCLFARAARRRARGVPFR